MLDTLILLDAHTILIPHPILELPCIFITNVPWLSLFHARPSHDSGTFTNLFILCPEEEEERYFVCYIRGF